jgi:erythromycin esterase-like protein
VTLTARSPPDTGLAALVRSHAAALPDLDDVDAFASRFDHFSDARIVLLGECTHGTREFYRARAAITRRLVERHGFRILAIEGDWPDTAELDRYLRSHGRWGDRAAFVNFPRWMWRNREFLLLLRDLRRWNEDRRPDDRVAIRGLDIYSLKQSIAAVLEYLGRIDPDAAGAARRRYGCMKPYLEAPQAYAAVARRTGRSCENAVKRQLCELLAQQLKYAAADGEVFFNAAQNARAVCASEAYYRALSRGSVESWNLRDSHMFDTLARLLKTAGAHSRAVVWAHNSHIGDARATAMQERGEHNLGGLCRHRFADQMVAIGFLTDRGSVLAADDWGGPACVKKVLPAAPGSWERVLQTSGYPCALLDWRAEPGLRDALMRRRLQRAIGVVYRPRTERASHYFAASLGGQFDAVVWFEETTALAQLSDAPAHGAPDIYPFGL